MTTAVTNTSSTSAADIFNAINGQSGSAKKTASATEDLQDKFLTLLMTQMKNQDPLNPMDNAQVTTQLAQINTVNGIEKLNSTLSQLVQSYSDSQAMQSAALIGKNVLVAGSTLNLANGLAEGGIQLSGPADTITVKVMDSTGKVVTTENLGARNQAGSFAFGWDGSDAAGNALPAGKYTFSVEATQGGNKVDAKALQIGTVNAVVRSTNGFSLDLGAQGTVTFGDVQQIL